MMLVSLYKIKNPNTVKFGFTDEEKMAHFRKVIYKIF